ncbi:DUF1707 domain-containing protein [Cutibacterium equinum]|uniref:DUF1707 domain-containing protein n=1 Tax=Cutibacterium equinum TaxID=3016342 RepID=A0ABY7QXH4_9ACTN|nr:DUF1707 domain-containing protein [Cutibacterium equinum]WCC79751.1 DUF1707 domain-containing protein [Cutibacterium equinum]
MTVPDDWRIGDAERARATDILDNAWVEGKLTRDEHDERVEAALQARTYGDLGGLLSDLGATVENIALPAVGHQGDPVRVAPGPDTDRMICIMSDTVWASGRTMAKHTNVIGIMGDPCFDLTSMSWASRHITIDLTIFMCDATLLVPDGVRIEDSMSHVLGEVKVLGLSQPGPDAPVLTLSGTNILSDVVIFGPGSKKFAKHKKRWNR